MSHIPCHCENQQCVVNLSSRLIIYVKLENDQVSVKSDVVSLPSAVGAMDVVNRTHSTERVVARVHPSNRSVFKFVIDLVTVSIYTQGRSRVKTSVGSYSPLGKYRQAIDL